MSRVVNKYQGEKYDVYIGRPSIWGNPFVMKNTSEQERNRVCEAYEKWFEQPEQEWLRKRLPELAGKTLCCFCKPKRCHGDYLVKKCRELQQEKKDT